VISVEEARERVLAHVAVLGSEEVVLAEALHRVLDQTIASERDIPPWPNSSMDGYAVRSADTGRASPGHPVTLRLAGRVPAGSVASRPVAAGETFRIFTGAPLPDGADGVVPQEEVETAGDAVRLRSPVAAGAYVRPRGEDLRRGDRIFAPGRLLVPADIGILATLGRHQVRVVQRPRVEVLQIPGRRKPAWVVSNAQPPRGLAGRLRRRAFRIPEHHPEHWALLLAADRLEVRLTRAKRWLAFAGGALALWSLLCALEER